MTPEQQLQDTLFHVFVSLILTHPNALSVIEVTKRRALDFCDTTEVLDWERDKRAS